MDLFVIMALLVGLIAVVMLVIVLVRLVGLLFAGGEGNTSQSKRKTKRDDVVDRLLSDFEKKRGQNNPKR